MNRELRRRLEDGLDEMAPKLADRILEQKLQPIASEAELFGEEQDVTVIRKMPPKGRHVPAKLCRAVVGLAAAFVLFFCLQEVRESNIIEGQIIVDVNPSLSLSVNKMGRVKKVEALNEDGISIVDGLSKRHGTVGDVLESVFVSLETQNYLKGDKSGVLVSYCYEQESVAVETHIQSAIENISGSRQNCTIYSQTFAREDEEEEKAKTAGVSVGKYYFVNRIKEGSGVSEEVSYDKTIEEIAQIIDNQGVQVAGVEVYSGGIRPASLLDPDHPGTPIEENPVLTTEKPGEPSTSPNGTEEPEDTQGTEEDPSSTEAPETNTHKPGTDKPYIEYPQQPETEDPKPQQPETEDPKPQEPGEEEPGTEGPEEGEPGSEEPGTEEPGEDEPGSEEPGTEEPDVSGLAISWVKAELGIDRKVYISWESLEMATAYEVYYRREGSKSYERIGECVTGTACVVAGLMPGRGYEFRIVPYLVVDGKKYFGEDQVSDVVRIDLEHGNPEPGEPEDGSENSEEPEDGTQAPETPENTGGTESGDFESDPSEETEGVEPADSGSDSPEEADGTESEAE